MSDSRVDGLPSRKREHGGKLISGGMLPDSLAVSRIEDRCSILTTKCQERQTVESHYVHGVGGYTLPSITMGILLQSQRI